MKRDACLHDVANRFGERLARREADRHVKKAGGPPRRWRATLRLPRIEADVVVVATGGQERCLITELLLHLESEDVAPEAEGALLQESGGPAELPPELFRFGVQYADGRKATTVGNPFPAGENVEGPVLLSRGGGGGGHEWDQSYWVWPLPPLGPVTFACEWPAHGVELTRREIDGSLILDAAANAQTLWEESSSHDESRAFQSSWFGCPYG